MQIAHVRASCPIYDEVRVVGCHVSVCARYDDIVNRLLDRVLRRKRKQ